MKFQTLYSRSEDGSIQMWQVEQQGTAVRRSWGMLGGKMIGIEEVFAPKQGRTAVQRAEARFVKLVQARIDNGWVSDRHQVRKTAVMSETDFDFSSLPDSFAPQKPVQQLPMPVFDLEKSVGRYLFQRKRDGQRHYVLITDTGEVRIYTRKMEEKTTHMPKLRRALEQLNLPKRTVLDGEVIVDRKGKDDFRATGQVCRAGESRAAAAEKLLPLRLMLFDMLFWRGKPVHQLPYRQRWRLLHDITSGRHDMIVLPETFERFAPARGHALKHRWEGLVIWDLDAPNSLRMNGKHVRSGCYKWKPIQEGDFVATGWKPGNGRLATTMGKLLIAQYVGGKLFEIGRVGSGFDDETRDAVAAGKWKFPCVVTLEYDKQETDSLALRFPVFVRKHPDKTVEELR